MDVAADPFTSKAEFRAFDIINSRGDMTNSNGEILRVYIYSAFMKSTFVSRVLDDFEQRRRQSQEAAAAAQEAVVATAAAAGGCTRT